MAGVAERWKKWERTRQMGRRRFVWRFGVCGWGLSTGVLWSVAFWYFMTPQPPFRIVLPLGLVGFAAAGYLWGAIMWWLGERGYRLAHRTAEGESASASDLAT